MEHNVDARIGPVQMARLYDRLRNTEVRKYVRAGNYELEIVPEYKVFGMWVYCPWPAKPPVRVVLFMKLTCPARAGYPGGPYAGV